jgi:hypothetical protein
VAFSREHSAEWIGVLPSKFDLLMAEGAMPLSTVGGKNSPSSPRSDAAASRLTFPAARHCDLLLSSPTGWHDSSTMTNQGRDRLFWVVACCIFISIGVAGWLIASFFLP